MTVTQSAESSTNALSSVSLWVVQRGNVILLVGEVLADLGSTVQRS